MRPENITWAVGFDDGKARFLCVEASSQRRMMAFTRRYEGVTHVVRPFGRTWDDRPMTSPDRKVLGRGIQRSMGRRSDSAPSPRRDDTGADRLIRLAADTHGLAVDDLLDPPSKEQVYARARGYAAHLLKAELGLSMPHIAELLNYRDHSGVRRWLDKPLHLVMSPFQQSRKQKGRP